MCRANAFDGLKILDRVRKAVGKIIGLPPDHETTRLSVNSIVGQILFYTFSWPVLAHLQPELKLTPDQLDRIADHIADLVKLQQSDIGEVVMSSLAPATTH